MYVNQRPSVQTYSGRAGQRSFAPANRHEGSTNSGGSGKRTGSSYPNNNRGSYGQAQQMQMQRSGAGNPRVDEEFFNRLNSLHIFNFIMVEIVRQ